MAQANSVPTVPGANGDRPLPKPQATRCAGCEKRKLQDGGLLFLMSKMIKPLVGNRNGLPVRVEQADFAPARDDLPDAP